ncbi:hypothetical protein COX00_00160 [Candidatus Uhrbacteria bacterium CG22_combo_CG10-13_8_21_14_all_47_17]|uniref:Uncharacterized protein n=1 Tax=Candidatus Uhrbacteria bacterium CG22_combo_CG10-13_8_21_14_all_47_17 TaxID=1975041 RepID=A0A2H0BVK3_9BACT|nr:MAG: hypothetical protein COX00_00160 [Candidatus Uhrbacteria bacterium CG22_combo_CG10-13_8_21_14_all_47_17]
MKNSLEPKHSLQQIRVWFAWVAFAATLLVFSYLFLSQNFFSSQSKKVFSSQKIVQAVSRLASVPNDAPSVKEIENPDLLREQNPSVFKNLLLGDWILEYQDRLIIYRPSTDSVIGTFPFLQIENEQ